MNRLQVIAINSSSRKMNTYELINQVKEILKDNSIDVEIINLFDYDIKACIGCEHCPEIYGKPVLVISTTKGSGLKATLKYLERVVIQWGGFNAGKIGRTIRNIDNKITESECENFINFVALNGPNKGRFLLFNNIH